jgi:hypothetical protein
MSYREVSVIEVKEMLRLWLEGCGLWEAARLSGTVPHLGRNTRSAVESFGRRVATCSTSAAVRRTVTNFKRRSEASRSAASGVTDVGATGVAFVVAAVITRSHRWW